MAEQPARRRRLALHWQILIGLVLGVAVGVVVNLAWSPYVWGALGVGDPLSYLKGREGRPAEQMPRSPGPALAWLEGALEEYAPGEGASALEPPRNAYTARTIDWLLRSVHGGPLASASEIGEQVEGARAPARPGAEDLAAAQAWLLEELRAAQGRLGAYREAQDDSDVTAEPLSPIAPPVEAELSEAVRWLVHRLEVERPNEDAVVLAMAPRFISNLTKFVGQFFIRALQFIAVPLVLFSLIVGASSLNDLRKLGRIGAKTVGIYLATTAIAITVGLVLANIVQPGKFVPERIRDRIAMQSAAEQGQTIQQRQQSAMSVDPWEQVLDFVPSNPFQALAETQMLQVVFAALAIGIGLTLIPREKAAPVIAIADGLTEVIIKLVNVLMLMAPYAVFALIVTVVADLGLAVLWSLVVYSTVVLGGLLVMVLAVYPGVMKALTPMGYRRFFRGVAPAQLVAFSSSSSAATLPVTMECAEERLGVSEEVSSFVLPLGATVNMDGTALYQGVAALFIAQLYSIPLDFFDQLTIIVTATLASIGTAAVPSAGLVMLIIVLQQLEFPDEVIFGGVAILFAVDRILDMCRTTCNITGDSMVAVMVASSEKALLSGEEVDRRRAEREREGLDEHPHRGTGDEYGIGVGSERRPVDVEDRTPPGARDDGAGT